VQHTTFASEAPCRHCRRPLIYAWDEGLLVRADKAPLDPLVASLLRGSGRRVYVLTDGGNLVYEPSERVGTLRLARSRHAEHVCRQRPSTPVRKHEQLAMI
jgi:hypothetical protein